MESSSSTSRIRGAEAVTFGIVGCFSVSSQMIEPRVYRAAFVPALLAVVLTMFSLQSRPDPLPQGLAADVLFDGRLAAIESARIAGREPDRRPGRPGNLRTAQRVAELLRGRGFPGKQTQVQRFTHDGKDLANVVARRAGE